MARITDDYGLPPLTFEEAARVLGVSVGAFREWVQERVQPSPTQWSQWKKTRPLPDALIRLYLSEHLSKARSDPAPAVSLPGPPVVRRKRAHR